MNPLSPHTAGERGPPQTRVRNRGVVVAAFPAAAHAGATALRAGGNAIDAACAAAWSLSVCEPGESGLGGQTTLLVRFADGRVLVLDGHSRAPAGLTRKECSAKAQRRGIRSASIPSTPATLGDAQRRYGRLGLATVLEPAIRLAEEGYKITTLQRRLLKWTRRFFKGSQVERELFLTSEGEIYQRGEVFRQPRLATTLRRLAASGVQDFYTGEIAREIVADMTERGGLITGQDLKDLDVPVEREPLAIQYRGHRVVSVPPPGGGVQVLLALRLLERALPPDATGAQWHACMVRATLAAFIERERWPDHPADMTPSLAQWLVSDARVDRLAEECRVGRAKGGPDVPSTRDTLGEEGNTTHLCAADGEGNVVSLTQSIQSVFGSKVAHPRLGFVYNNYLSTCPRTPHPYRLGPGCLPQSNAAPTIVLGSNGAPRMALGSAGSRRITSSVVQVVSGVLDRGATLRDAVAEPRAHALLNGSVWVEDSASSQTKASIAEGFARTRLLSAANYKLGAVQALAWDRDGTLAGEADPRRDGAAADG